MKLWLIFFSLWVLGCVGAYVWLKPLEVSHEAPFKPVKIEKVKVEVQKKDQKKEFKGEGLNSDMIQDSTPAARPVLNQPLDSEMIKALEKIQEEEKETQPDSVE